MGVSWIKKGSESAKSVADYETEIKNRQLTRGKLWRFYLKTGESAQVTFVDGALSKDGVLEIPTTKEHRVHWGGEWTHFVCTACNDEPCPICEGGDKPSLIGVLTIIDHRESTNKDATKKFKDQKRLFVAKKDTIKLLQKMAVTRKGLVGCKYEVSRIGDQNSAASGTHFEFIDKAADTGVLKQKYQRKIIDDKTKAESMVTNFIAANYEMELSCLPATKLREMGFGTKKIGGEPAYTEPSQPDESEASLSEHL